LIFGRIYDYTGFGCIGEELFRHLVISRLTFPLSKLKTTEYLYRYQGRSIDVNAIYRFLDRSSNSLKHVVEQIAFRHTQRTLGKASKITHNIYQITYQLPDTKQYKPTVLKMDEQQNELYNIVQKYF